MDSDEGPGWSRAQADTIEELYKRFMYLTFFSDHSIVPTHDIDAFWHQHILDTQKYADDCETVFGRFVHHFPYFGMRGPADEENFEEAFRNTRHLYTEVFGGDYTEGSLTGARCEGGKCGGSCGGTHCKPKTIQPELRPSFTV